MVRSRRREADGSLSPCVRGIDECSGTGEEQELWKAWPWTVNRDAGLWENDFKASFQRHCVTFTAEGGCFGGLLYFYTTELGLFTVV